MKNVYLLILISLIFISLFNYYLYHILRKVSILTGFKNFLIYFLFSFIFFIFLDFYVYKFFGHGFPSSISEEKFERSPSPYDMFSGKPYYKDHNSHGFRGDDFKNIDKDTFQIAFFGGSTGYNGEPPIIKLVENQIKKQGTKVKTFNFSSVSSNHNQHLHRLLKYTDLNFDLVIFYGGFNETIQTYLYDPRPGYPFNYWIRNELSKIKYLLLKYSSIYAEYEKQTGNVSGLNKIRQNINFLSDQWLDSLLLNYEQTLNSAKKISESLIENNLCNSTKFLAFYQPISINGVDDYSKKIIKETKKYFLKKSILIDISEVLNQSDFTDSVHINQNAKNIIAQIISEHINNKVLPNCN